jgi:hypothetical protein
MPSIMFVGTIAAPASPMIPFRGSRRICDLLGRFDRIDWTGNDARPDDYRTGTVRLYGPGFPPVWPQFIFL